jgi:hypothetical protein
LVFGKEKNTSTIYILSFSWKKPSKKMNASCFLFDQEKQQPLFFRREDGKDDRAHVYLFFCSLSMP